MYHLQPFTFYDSDGSVKSGWDRFIEQKDPPPFYYSSNLEISRNRNQHKGTLRRQKKILSFFRVYFSPDGTISHTCKISILSDASFKILEDMQ